MKFYSKLRFKLFILLAIFSIVPTILITIISYRNFSASVKKEVYTLSENLLTNSYKDINYTLREINTFTQTFFYQQTSSEIGIISILEQYANPDKPITPIDRLHNSRSLDTICSPLLFNYNYINSIVVFFADGTSFSKGKSSDLKNNYNPQNDKWYINTISKNEGLYVSDISQKDFLITNKPSITFSRALYSSKKEFLGVLLIDCSLDIFNAIESNSIVNVIDLYLNNEKGKTVYSNSDVTLDTVINSDITQNYSGIIEDDFSNQVYVYNTISNYNWKLIAKINPRELAKDFDVRPVITIVGLICSILFVFTSYIVSNWISTPISELSKIMKNQTDQLVITQSKFLKSENEIGILYNQYNFMIEKINLYIKESYQNKLISLDSQMQALEAQINSHFLFNTLEAIYSIAEIEEIETISIMTKSLGDMFRYSIKTKSELVELNDELNHVNNYLKIQKIRFADKLNYTFDIPESLLKYRILKVILQPLVENAVQHGIISKRGSSMLTVKGFEQSNVICFEIIDNGIGMSEQQLETIKNTLSSRPEFTELGRRSLRSIGIQNVHTRIQLYYGTQYGITIESKKGIGTTVYLKIPKRA